MSRTSIIIAITHRLTTIVCTAVAISQELQSERKISQMLTCWQITHKLYQNESESTGLSNSTNSITFSVTSAECPEVRRHQIYAEDFRLISRFYVCMPSLSWAWNAINHAPPGTWQETKVMYRWCHGLLLGSHLCGSGLPPEEDTLISNLIIKIQS